MKKYLTENKNSESYTPSLVCECGSSSFKKISDASMKESTAQWIECIHCRRKYDIRVNLITQEYVNELKIGSS